MNLIKEKRPIMDREDPYWVLHSDHGLGFGWFFINQDYSGNNLFDSIKENYICSCRFLNRKFKDKGITVDIFNDLPISEQVGTITHWDEIKRGEENAKTKTGD